MEDDKVELTKNEIELLLFKFRREYKVFIEHLNYSEADEDALINKLLKAREAIIANENKKTE